MALQIVLEKRLGIAQLLLLLAVLVFMSLTRGSRGEAVMVPSVNRSALRAWGRRHLSLKNLSGSGDWDWVGRLKSRSRSRSHSPKPALLKPTDAFGEFTCLSSCSAKKTDYDADPPIKLEFPSVDEKPPVPPSTANKPKPPRLNLHGAVRPRSRTRSIGSNTIVFDSPRARSRTPTLMRTPHHRRPATPTHVRAQNTPAHPSTRATPLPMQQSVSQGAHAPRSARRWARTAHLHELRGGATGSVQRLGVAQEAVMPRSAGAATSVVSLNSDVFASPSPASSGPRSADLLDARLRTNGSSGGRGELLFRGLALNPAMLDRGQVASAEDAGEGDLWVDTDEGSEMDGDGDVDVGVESPWMDQVERVAIVA